MTEEQLTLVRDEITRAVTIIVPSVVKETVNGKLDRIHGILEKQNEATSAFHDKVDAHIARVEPVIGAFEEEKRFKEGVSDLGERVIWWSKVVGAAGVVALAVKYAIFNSMKL